MKRGAAMAIGAAAVAAAAASAAWYWTAHASPEARHREIVRLHLNDPDSAVFRAAFPAKRGGEGIWCGELNARNRTGGMVGFTRYVAEMPQISAALSPEELRSFSRITFDDDGDGFHTKWNLMCQAG